MTHIGDPTSATRFTMTRVLANSNELPPRMDAARVLQCSDERPTEPQALSGSVASGPELAIVHDILAGTVALYRNRARRLMWLASTAVFQEAKLEFLALARRYELLAEHAAGKADGLRFEQHQFE
jgi:hypothetical protein